MNNKQMEEWYDKVFEEPVKKIKINGRIIKYEQKLNQISQFSGGILEFIEMNLKERDGAYELNGNEDKQQAIESYIEFLQYYYYQSEDTNWFHPNKMIKDGIIYKECAKKLGYVLCCGGDLGDGLKYFGMYDECGRILGELFISMGEWVCDSFKKDKERKWKDFVSIGMKWALVCRPKEIIQNYVMAKVVIDFYNLENVLTSI